MLEIVKFLLEQAEKVATKREEEKAHYLLDQPLIDETIRDFGTEVE